jgi:hypothetical protein
MRRSTKRRAGSRDKASFVMRATSAIGPRRWSCRNVQRFVSGSARVGAALSPFDDAVGETVAYSDARPRIAAGPDAPSARAAARRRP